MILQDTVLEPIKAFLPLMKVNHHELNHNWEWEIVAEQISEATVDKSGEVKFDMVAVFDDWPLFY